MNHPLYITFLWHMHQPYYKNLVTGQAIMPWVRLHGIKDYLDMPQMLEDFPQVHQSFNLVPSLIEQIHDYEKNEVKDDFLEVSRKKASGLSEEEKAFILLNFFTCNWDNMVRPMPRFYDLLLKRGKYVSPEHISRITKYFTDQEYLDLQVLYNLAWFDPVYKEKFPELAQLASKGREFTEEEKNLALDKQLEILRQIVPGYKALQDKGLIEVSVTPYFHPILPLLCDTNIARVAAPKIPLPKRFSHPEDARWQVEKAVQAYEKSFGIKPRGMWPSEGSVSEAILPILMENGIQWLATDEEVLLRSLKVNKSGDVVYKPYLLERDKGKLSIIFRDHALSDLIGFTYAKMSAKDAVSDFMKHINNIKKYLSSNDGAYVVPVILDGENAWEFYKNDGRDFLSMLYEEISRDRDIKAATVSEVLEACPPKDRINDLFPASWINGNFAVWIGHEEKNRSWDYLNQARQDLVAKQEQDPAFIGTREHELAWRLIYIAEGSDWNWWYGDDHSSDYDEEFDLLFRTHLITMYNLIGRHVPEYLNVSIRKEEILPSYEPVGFFEPVIDGKVTNYYEWLSAGYLECSKTGGTMHQSHGIIQNVYYGFSRDNFYLRLGLDLPSEENGAKDLRLAIDFSKNTRVELGVGELHNKPLKVAFYKKDKEGQWQLKKEIDTAAFEKIFELGLPLKDLGKKANDEMHISFIIKKEDVVIETCPSRGPIVIKVPPEDFEAENWLA